MKRWSSVTMGLLVIAVTAFGFAGSSYGQADAGWTTLIDGATGLDNWNRVGDANWRAVDGAIQADQKTDKGASFLVTKNSYTDFQIRVEFWASDDANSGIFMRCADPNTLTDKTCYEANIFDQRPDPTYGTGAIVHIAAVSPMPKAGGKWNTYDITVKGTRLTLTLNGVRTVDVEDSKFPSGPIALQYAAGVMKFRKVQIKPL
ncbi:MAG: 3-keto-disaccharide hydrolase [Candidatus Methylomirabilales bacterium]